MLNEMNRSVGQHDAYPFVLTEKITSKLTFVHESIAAFHRARALHARIERAAGAEAR
jgi:hypothetical protein